MASPSTGKINLLLDLDNTLISSLTFAEAKKFNPSEELSFETMGKYWKCFRRPHLEDFLDFAFDHFDVSVFTAASKSYMLFIIDKMILTKPNRKLRLMLFDQNCEESRKLYNPKTPKDLKYVFNFEGFHLCNTILIDDLIHVKKAQPEMVIRCPYFDAAKKRKAPKDTFLLDVQITLKQLCKLYSNHHCVHD